MATPATASPTTGVSASGCRSTRGRTPRPSSRMPVPTTAATRPKTRAQRNITPFGCWNGGSPGMAREKVPNPVSESRPMKMRVPTPAARRPGTSTSPRIGPPRPAASISRKAPAMGEPNRVLMAAKLPAAAITVAAVGGASLVARCTARTPSPPPMAIRGASGPSTTPRLRVARAASRTPGISSGSGVPPVLNPSAGECPPVPGRYRMTELTSRPATPSRGRGHHAGGPWNPICTGKVWKNHSCSSLTTFRNP